MVRFKSPLLLPLFCVVFKEMLAKKQGGGVDELPLDNCNCETVLALKCPRLSNITPPFFA